MDRASTICNICGNPLSATTKQCAYCAKMPLVVKCEITVLVMFFAMLIAFVKQIPQNVPVIAVQEPETSADVLFNVPKLAGKTEAEIEALLGEPVFCAKSESALNCAYRENEIEIVFIDGKADWITVYSAFRSPSYQQKVEGKSKADVLKLLGEPSYCAKAKSDLQCAFRDGDVTVEFIDGKVDGIVVKGDLSRVAYGKEALALLGLPVKEANFGNKKVMRWENISGLSSVTLRSEDNNSVSLVAVKARTK
jgi:hypothetical protein